ncbi:MAG: hypothetical protein CVU73_06990 [Deltaproteobacteria bacterium HGW-Deltaproteobacteria-8]|nr:MAG: hypothetical protein CVU73_06990 [Deltaproteobacteria bacterium HGW-Deltaproteobacteria-8]
MDRGLERFQTPVSRYKTACSPAGLAFLHARVSQAIAVQRDLEGLPRRAYDMEDRGAPKIKSIV